MPRGHKGEKRPADVIGAAVMVGRIATGEIGEAAAKLGCDGKGVEGHHLNDDKSPLIDLLSCVVCKGTMKIEKSAPDPEGHDIIQYRCKLCDSIERVRLFRRSRDTAG